MGLNDNFDLDTSHVLAALLRKAHEAKRAGARETGRLGFRASRVASFCMSTTSRRPAFFFSGTTIVPRSSISAAGTI